MRWLEGIPGEVRSSLDPDLLLCETGPGLGGDGGGGGLRRHYIGTGSEGYTMYISAVSFTIQQGNRDLAEAD